MWTFFLNFPGINKLIEQEYSHFIVYIVYIVEYVLYTYHLHFMETMLNFEIKLKDQRSNIGYIIWVRIKLDNYIILLSNTLINTILLLAPVIYIIRKILREYKIIWYIIEILKLFFYLLLFNIHKCSFLKIKTNFFNVFSLNLD
jgi:hypothetical protein